MMDLSQTEKYKVIAAHEHKETKLYSGYSLRPIVLDTKKKPTVTLRTNSENHLNKHSYAHT